MRALSPEAAPQLVESLDRVHVRTAAALACKGHAAAAAALVEEWRVASAPARPQPLHVAVQGRDSIATWAAPIPEILFDPPSRRSVAA